jgi:hypothetical protein
VRDLLLRAKHLLFAAAREFRGGGKGEISDWPISASRRRPKIEPAILEMLRAGYTRHLVNVVVEENEAFRRSGVLPAHAVPANLDQ